MDLAQRTNSAKDLLILGLFGLLLLGSSVMAQAINVIPPRLPDRLPEVVMQDQPQRDQLTRILAIRVEFVRDTLSTTTRDGSFDYGYIDTLHFDPPPHDSLYFADNLEFLQFYWEGASNGAVELSWDIYPSGIQAAYQLPKQMWQYNYNHTDEQLDHGLAELFRDAVQAADQDDAIIWDNYDLVMIFHAGAGAEFDVGFTVTPHDLPSAWMVQEDFRSQLSLDDGILVVDNGDSSYVDGGLILPETESHDDIQISMLGVLCSLFGHTLGLPGLYDSDDGQAVVGKWSLMDRGFGNFYGAIPAELDAWSRIYKRWITPTVLSPGEWTIAARGFAYPDTATDTIRTGKIVISPTEYYLIENRNRDPEGDSIAVAYDREGRTMTFKEDYTVEAEDGFRVPVRIDNLDFDSPGSGILIWHVDEALYPLLREKRFNSQNDRRGLDIEEADGAQDIGQDYAFLTPGYGTDYGVFEDAWYKDNVAHRNANSYRVRFNDDSYPSSKANSGASTHITIDDFSKRDTVMTFSWSKSFVQEGFPVSSISITDMENYALGNFDDDPYDEIMVFGRLGNLNVIDGDGSIIYQTNYRDVIEYPVEFKIRPGVADINSDGRDDVVMFTQQNTGGSVLFSVMSSGEEFEVSVIATSDYLIKGRHIMIGGDPDNYKIFCAFEEYDETDQWVKNLILDKNFNVVGEHQFDFFHEASYHLIGSAESDTFLVVSYKSNYPIEPNEHRIAIINDNEILLNELIERSSNPLLADFDASGSQDLILPTTTSLLIIPDIAVNGLSEMRTEVCKFPFSQNQVGDYHLMPADIDGDGQYEIFGYYDYSAKIIGLEMNGVAVDQYPGYIPSSNKQWSFSLLGSGVSKINAHAKSVVDLNGDGHPSIFGLTQQSIHLETDTLNHVTATDFKINHIRAEGSTISPIAIPQPFGKWFELCQLDDDSDVELLYFSGDSVNVIEIPATNPTIWWGSQYRDKQNRNAVWEPAQPHSVASSDPIMPEDLCYNWPNPARESTAIRYFLNFDASVKVDIFDITGQRVTTLYGNGVAGQHQEIPWNTGAVARGGYIAVVEAKGDGRTESKIVKIAVVK